jgi:HSP20 family protein
MALLRRSFRDPDRYDNSLRRVFGEFAREWPSYEDSSLTAWNPSVDIYETENALVVKAELPGIDQKDLHIGIENNILTLHGERRCETDVKEENYHRMECSYGSFTRSFSLPTTVDEDKVRAEFKNGMLKVELPKKEQAKRKQIPISA